MSKTIGILGGMGPLATLDIFEKIIKHTPATKDQEHLPVIIYNNPKIPPRTYAYYKDEKKLLTDLRQGSIILEQAGADFIIMPCHTSHIWLQDIQNSVKIPFLSIVENTVEWILTQGKFEGQQILLLATSATVESSIYQKYFQVSSIKIITPKLEEQEIVTAAIAQVKAGFIHNNPYLKPLKELVYEYKKTGISAILGGCTEIPILFPLLDEGAAKIDPTLLLVKTAIKKAIEPLPD